MSRLLAASLRTSFKGHEPDKRSVSDGTIECSRCGEVFDEVLLVDRGPRESCRGRKLSSGDRFEYRRLTLRELLEKALK